MNIPTAQFDDQGSQHRQSWTWADQISTYRFWALLAFFLFAGAGMDLFLSSAQQMRWMEVIHGSHSSSQVGVITAWLTCSRYYGYLFGMLLAWFSMRSRPVVWLIVLCGLKAVGGALFTCGGPEWIIVVRVLGNAMVGMASGAIWLIIPSILAGGRGSSEMFVVSFGLIGLANSFVSYLSGLSMGLMYSYSRSSSSTGIIIILIGLVVFAIFAIAFLIPLLVLPNWRELFNGNPPPRGYALPSLQHDPIAAALLCLIPFYSLYWIYRAHGEVAAVAPSRSILSPHASLLVTFFFPLMFPIVMVSLVDVLNARISAPRRSPWAVGIWAFFVLPVAVWLVQEKLNQVIYLTQVPNPNGTPGFTS